MNPRMRSIPLAVTALLAALALPWGGGGGGGGGTGGGGGGGGNTPPANTVWVGNGGGMIFTPSTLAVSAGTTVTFEFKSGTHNVVSGSGTPDGKFSSGSPQTSGTWTNRFSTAGTFPYYCEVHGSMMSGTIVVN